MDKYKYTFSLIGDKNIPLWTRWEKKVWFIILIIGTSALYATRTSLPLLLPAISKERKWTKLESGTLLSSFFWGYTLTQVIGGYISDKVGGLKVIFISALGWSSLTFFMPFFIRFLSDPDASFLLILCVRILNGAFQGVHFPSMISLTSQKLPEKERSPFFSVLTSGSAIGTLVSGTLGSYFLEHYGWPVVFYLLGALGVSWALLLKYQAVMTDSRSVVLLPSVDKDRPPDRSAVPWLKLLTTPAFWACVIAHSCQMNCFFMLMSWLPTYFHDNFPDAKRWVVNMIPWLLLLPSTFLAKHIGEQLVIHGHSITTVRKIIESVCLGGQSTCLLLLASAGGFKTALVCAALAVAAAGFHNNAVAINAQDLAPSHSGSVFGIVNTLGSISAFTAVYVAGHMLEVGYSWLSIFQLTAIIDLIGWFVFLIYGTAESII